MAFRKAHRDLTVRVSIPLLLEVHLVTIVRLAYLARMLINMPRSQKGQMYVLYWMTIILALTMPSMITKLKGL